MHRHSGFFAILLVLLLGWSQAQTAPPPAQATIEEIRVTGANETLAGLIKVSIDVQEGDPVTAVQAKLPGVIEAVRATGYFRSVNATIRAEGTRYYLEITVQPNPDIAEVVFAGNSFAPSADLAQVLEQQLNVAPGTAYNTVRGTESSALIGQYYRARGFPFTPKVTLETTTLANGKYRLTYTIDESAKISKVVVSGNTLVPTAQIEAAFKPLVDKGSFDVPSFMNAAAQVSQLYAAQGYRGSGVSPTTTELTDGTLNVGIAELRVATIEAQGFDLPAGGLSVKSGDLFNYDKLLSDLPKLQVGQGKQVHMDVEQTGPDAVAVTLSLQDAPAGPIQSIQVVGNTVVPTADIVAALKQKPGEQYNAQVAADADLRAVVDLYSARGYSIVPQADVSFENGVYTFKVREQRLVGYDLQWSGEHRTQDVVVTRELPEPGGIFNVNALRSGLSRLQQTGIIASLRPSVRVPDPNKPDEVVFVLNLEEARTGLFQPAIGYNTLTGFEGSLTYSENNLWGLNHIANVNIQAGQNAAGQVLSGGVSYSIPWLYIDFLDFKRVRTGVTFTASSTVSGGNVLSGTQPPTGETFVDDPSTPQNEADPKQRLFTVRTTGAGVELRRPIGDFFTVGISYNFQYQQSFLEHDNTVAYYKNDAEAEALLPATSASHFVGANGEFNTKNSVEFPTSGVLASVSTGYGFGSQGATALSYTQTTVGFRAYFGFGLDDKGQFGIGPDRNMALAGRVNAGAIIGTAPAGRIFSLGDSGQNEEFRLRGYSFGDLRGEVFYTGSLEFRYDFGLTTAVTQGLVGVAFLDFGNAWGNGSRATRTDKNGVVTTIPEGIQFGYGIGLQVNLGFGAFQLPALRFDYGFSPWNPGGKFSFRFGFPF